MKGLIIKDLIVLLKQLKVFLILIAVFAFLPNFSMTSFAIFYSAIIPISLLSFDEQSKWNKYLSTMPISKKDIVISKYIVGSTTVVGAFIVSVIGQIIGNFTGTEVIIQEILLSKFVFACFAIIIQSLMLPPIFKFGVEKGRHIFVIAIAIISALTFVVFNIASEEFGSITVMVGKYIYLIPFVSVAVVAGSIALSVKLFKTRQY